VKMSNFSPKRFFGDLIDVWEKSFLLFFSKKKFQKNFVEILFLKKKLFYYCKG
jgi:hypothetical protein